MAKQVVKVTLSTGKVVIMRNMKITDTETAAQEVAPRANGDQQVLQILMQRSLVKNLLLKIGDKDLTPTDREDLDALFSMSEYSQLLKVVSKISGGDDMGKDAQIEVVSSGDK